MDGGALATNVATPTSIQEVEQLVQRLYQPGPPSLITSIDAQLKQLQSSAEGWQLADALLASSDINVRFFGALTFQVKLNNDGAKLDADTASSVLMRLIEWTVQIDRNNDGSLVKKKLFHTLGTYFVRSPVLWKRPLVQLATSFQQGRAVSENQLAFTEDDISPLLSSLSESQIRFLLSLSGTLATDGGRVENNNPARAPFHQQMKAIVLEAIMTIRCAMTIPSPTDSSEIKGEILECFLSWINYAQSMWTAESEALSPLRDLVSLLAPFLADDALQSEAFDVFRDVLESYPAFFAAPCMEVLARMIEDSIASRMLQALQDTIPEVLPVVQFIVAYGLANLEHIVEQSNSVFGSRTVIQLLIAVLDSPGYPGDEDEVSAHCIEFWNGFVEYIIDRVHSDAEGRSAPWVNQANAICLELSTWLWRKMRTPSSEVAQSWTDTESEGFKEFRTDASELVLSLYTTLGRDLLQRYISLALNALSSKNWQDYEASIFCINALVEHVAPDDVLLGQLFQSSLFRDIADSTQHIPSQACRTTISTLGLYSEWISQHADYLPDTIRFLLASLENTRLVESAARALESLCSACRSNLTGEVDGFIAQYNHLATNQVLDQYASEKVIRAIAVIVQAITPESAKARPLTALLDIIDSTVDHATRLAQQSDVDAATAAGVAAVTHLASIGKNLQDPSLEETVDLDGESELHQDSFWYTPDGQAIQFRILNSCLAVLRLLPSSGEAVHEVCEVLKSGSDEEKPGPFVFPPEMTIRFMEECSPSTPQLAAVLSLAQNMLVVLSRKRSERTIADVNRIYQKVRSFILAMSEPSQDPEVAQACLDVVKRMITAYPHILLDTVSTGEQVRPVLDFSLKALEGQDIFPKRSAAAFWNELIGRSKPGWQDDAVRARAAEVLSVYGPLLCHRIVNLITGAAQRSELQHISEPLRLLLQNRSETRGWIEAVLLGGSLTTSLAHVREAERRRFVQLLAAAQGTPRKFREQVNNIYATCRGTVVSYDLSRQG